MKKETIFFNPIGGSAPLSIYFYEVGTLGDAIESLNENGVGWFAPNGELLAVQFDNVEEKNDAQVLDFDAYKVEVRVKQGKVSHVVTQIKEQKSNTTRQLKRKHSAA